MILRLIRRPASLAAALALSCVLPIQSARASGGGQWIELEPLQLPRQEVGAARIDDRVFVCGGLIGTFPPWTATATVEIYDVPTDTWSSAAPMPVALDHMGVAAHGGLLYVIGGFSADFTARKGVWAYDPAADAWSPRAPLPEARGACWAVTHGERLFVFGGTGPSGVMDSTLIYDPLLDLWSVGAPMPTAREHLNAVVVGDAIHVLGGRAGAATSANERYHPATDSWTIDAPMPTARSAMAAAAFDGQVFAMGGEVPMLHATNEVYDPWLDSWSSQADMHVPRHGVAAVTLDDRILLPAGGTIQGLAPTDRNDSFLPAPPQSYRSYCACAAGAPCGNSDPAAGCANSTGAGARLDPSGSSSVARADLAFRALGLPAGQPALLFVGEEQVAGGAGAPFGDGLRCAGTNVVRLGTHTADGGGLAVWSGDLGALGGWGAGDLRRFQAWYRDPPGPCASGFNLSDAVEVRFTP